MVVVRVFRVLVIDDRSEEAPVELFKVSLPGLWLSFLDGFLRGDGGYRLFYKMPPTEALLIPT